MEQRIKSVECYSLSIYEVWGSQIKEARKAWNGLTNDQKMNYRFYGLNNFFEMWFDQPFYEDWLPELNYKDWSIVVNYICYN